MSKRRKANKRNVVIWTVAVQRQHLSAVSAISHNLLFSAQYRIICRSPHNSSFIAQFTILCNFLHNFMLKNQLYYFNLYSEFDLGRNNTIKWGKLILL